MCKRSELDDIIKIVVDIYRKTYGEDIVEIILYGSYARGEEQNDSDIDIVAIVNGERKLLQDALVEVWNQVDDVSIDYETIISPTVIPYQEYMKWKEDIPYYHNIDKEGIRVA
ncbi:MAG: nucleotidyltransferase domain-containing protein [Lachnospiraceae bacterium]|nr:nucleotidyltransferase domain-containing protein [Lachnospiraceae bacterium]